MAHDDEHVSRDGGSAADNPPHEDDAIDRRISDQPSVTPARWVRRAVLLLVLVIATYIGWRISAAFFPRWWAQRIADQVQGRFIAGTLWGLFYGSVFTFVPLLLLFQIRRRFFSWTWRGLVAVVAVVLAAPNWLTLAVVAGTSNAAHAGERIMDVDAPSFRAATLIGVVAGALLAIVITATSMRMRHRTQQVEQLKHERDQLRARQSPEDDKNRE
ncbi:MAG: hypothetical protein WB508_07745 [Aeromicrobium sp.]|uniref:hypothetical protein n=1 Tax=Aeromicrobium sp. TaxID=1871063 RepID=UPI003C5D365B